MKKKSLYKNKTQMIIYNLIFIICIILFVVIGKTNFKKDEPTEAKKFSSIYNLVSDDNVFVFSDATEVLNIINGRSGIIFLGFPQNKWSNYYAMILNNVARELGIDKIYYYNFLKDRDESNGTYETIVNKLNVYIMTNDEGTKDLYAPTVLIVKNGEIIGFFDDTNFIKGTVSPELYYTENQLAITYEGFKTALLNYIN